MSDRSRLEPILGAVLLGVALLGGLVWWLRGDPSGPAERVVLIVVDTLRRDFVSAYGDRAATPVLDELARSGMRFDRALASFHQTSMSMGSLFTGRTPSLERDGLSPSLPWNAANWCGLARLRDDGDDPAVCLPNAVPTLAERLREAGFWTIGVASNQFLFEPSGFSRGFDDWVEVGLKPERVGPLERLSLRGAKRTRTWVDVNRAVDEALARRADDRFFLYVHYMDVHDYAVDVADLSRLPAAYGKAVAAVDVAIGKLLERLEAEGLRRGTAIVVTADHGERLRERHALPGRPGHLGNPSFQEMLEVPLLVAPAPSRDPAALLRTQDLFGLVLELAGLGAAAPPEVPDGELLIGERRFRTYYDGRFKTLLRREDGRQLLFDLARDPAERRDVASSHPDVVRRHRERIEDLSSRLAATRRGAPERLSERDRERLRMLGYLEDLEADQRAESERDPEGR